MITGVRQTSCEAAKGVSTMASACLSGPAAASLHLLFCWLPLLQAAVESSIQDAAEQSGEQGLFKQEMHEAQSQVR
jgi:hypothetical protein